MLGMEDYLLNEYVLLLLFNVFGSCLIFLGFACSSEGCVQCCGALYTFLGTLHSRLGAL